MHKNVSIIASKESHLLHVLLKIVWYDRSVFLKSCNNPHKAWLIRC